MRLWTYLVGTATRLTRIVAALAVTAESVIAQKLPTIGHPVDKLLGFQPAATELASDIHWLDHFILVIITVITIFVTSLLLYVAVRYNSKRNPKPATFTHNSPLEVAWTVVPIVILFVIGAFSLPILFKQQEIPVADITIKATGNQWYWDYEYVGEDVAFDSFLVDGSTDVASLGPDQPMSTPQVLDDVAVMKLEALGYTRGDFLLATDTAVIVPVGKTIVVQVTGADVIHAWTIPAFGVKQDAVPGRLAQLWFSADQEGIFFGQCSEICGQSHAYMPVTVKVVNQATYDAWLQSAKGGQVQLSADMVQAPTIIASN
ncbi:MAG: cytochrome c oxidase subunit 2 [Paracoccaceae bacterium]|jgi:cytochrome c oxidase subunit 2